MHIHVHGHGGEAKFWIEPNIDLALNAGLSKTELGAVRRMIEEHIDDIQKAWQRHFGR